MSKRFGRNQKRKLQEQIALEQNTNAVLRMHLTDALKTVEKQQGQLMSPRSQSWFKELGPLGEALDDMMEYAKENDPGNPHLRNARFLLSRVKDSYEYKTAHGEQKGGSSGQRT